MAGLQRDSLQWNSTLQAFDAGRFNGTPQRITNVAAGALTANSTDAVNGSQLYNTNSSVASLSTAINTGGVSGVMSLSTGLSNTNSSVASLSTSVATLSQDALQYDSTTGAYDASRGSSGLKKITNVAAGTVSATSTDVVTGGQLFTVRSDVAAMMTNWSSAGGSVTAIALGMGASAQGSSSLAVGANALATQDYTTAFGTNANASAAGATAIGSNAVAAAQARGTNSIAIGGEAVAASSNDVAIGVGATASGTSTGSAVSIGSRNVARGAGAVAIGDPNYAYGQGAVAMGLDSIASSDGTAAGANADGAIAVGNNAVAVGQGSLSLGNKSNALTTGSIALGDQANVRSSATRGIAIGVGATASMSRSVAIGDGATTSAVVSYSALVLGNTTYGGFAGTSPVGAFSVGSVGNERVIQNVAAGRVTATSTDAVNGSQLYAVASTTLTQITSLSTGLLVTTNSVASLSTSVSQLSNGGAGPGGGGVASLSTGLSGTNSSVASLSTGLSSTNSTVAVISSGVTSSNSSIASLSTGLNTTNSTVGTLSTGVASLSTGLIGTNSSVAALSSSLANGQYGPLRYGSSPSAPATGQTSPNELYLQPGSGTGPVVLHNVAAGKVTAESTDAINGGQIFALGNSLASALGGGSTFNGATGQFSAPSYRVQGASYESVGGAISALDTGLTSLQNNMNQVTAHLQTQITRNRSIASGGVASAFAMSQMRFTDRPGSQSIGIGGGYYDNQGAMAVGYGFTSEDGAWRGTASVSYTPTVNKLGVAGGLTYSW
ncbi:beta strand repeat-containing protein [Methylobacterium sp. J-076]|uniref:beta strand repeat-containing protein n=1 Tax=Methylobacterium sp. J-076 TaxID=2836655 RepID=UPI001FB91C5C|nr:YadA-like family protein [Methylobacterium sp. J-076]MCJ2013056.1 YadA-like family protein [Methylobacterium sp. J-076]